MRQIKFRGKGCFSEKWVYGDLLNFNDNTFIETSVVYPDTVGQFTGLFDKNGKEIYEGDILLCHGKYTFEVIWMNCSFIVKGKIKEIYNTIEIGNFFPAEIEVIGNIHDNPELLRR